MTDTHTAMSPAQLSAVGAALVAAWEAGHVYHGGDIIQGPNPLPTWDRVRMWFGFSRKSPATVNWRCIDGGYGDAR